LDKGVQKFKLKKYIFTRSAHLNSDSQRGPTPPQSTQVIDFNVARYAWKRYVGDFRYGTLLVAFAMGMADPEEAR
jgi:hypothetical protein